MKKKIIAALLTLCMVMSLLPLSALAAAWTATFNGEQITLNVADNGKVSSEPDKSTYYTFEKVTDQDTFTYYEIATGKRGELTATPVSAIVETPVFSPAAGEVEAGSTVAIACATEGAAIYYTTDGSDPTSASTAYSTPITISEAVTIKAIAIKDGVNSEVTTASYTVPAAPACTCTTKCTAENKNTECPVCNAADADLDAVCTGAAVESNVITAGADTSGSTITVNTEALKEDQTISDMITAAKDATDDTQGSIVITVPEESVDDSALQRKPLDVTLPEKLLTAVKDDTEVSTITVNVANVTLNLPVVGLPASVTADAKLTIQTKAATANNAGGIELKLNNGSATFSIPVTVEITVSTTLTNPTVAYNNNGRWERVRSDFRSGCKFFTRHFSEFVVAEAENTVAAQLVDMGTGRKHIFEIEADEALITALKGENGEKNYVWNDPVASEMADSTVTANVNAPASAVDGYWSVLGTGIDCNPDGTVNLADGQASIYGYLGTVESSD